MTRASSTAASAEHRNEDGVSVPMGNLRPDADSARSAPQNRNANQGTGRNGQQHAHYSHMTLDGRRRTANQNPSRPSNGDEQWNDWTSTWRRMGDKGRSQAVTMTGTITRGKRKGQQVDVQLDLTERELLEISTLNDSLTASMSTPQSSPSTNIEAQSQSCSCGVEAGPHVLLLSMLAFPFILFASLFVSFYFGALTWQNIFSYFYDERTIWHRIFICPFLVILFPVFIIAFTFGIAIYAAFVQLSWSFINWKIEVSSLEKGFYGWLCAKIDLENCSPYTVIELFGSDDTQQNTTELPGSDRVAVSYADPNESRRSRRSRSAIPMGSSHLQMERVESVM